jgi:hypothetical protein
MAIGDATTRIFNVHWADKGPLSLFLGWQATMIDPSGGGAPPLWLSGSDMVMNVAVVNLPALDRTRLVIHLTAEAPDQDHVQGTFPDGAADKPTGTITADYFAALRFGTATLNGNVAYHTDAGHNQFNGASVVSIATTVNLPIIAVRDHGYEWFAIAGAGGVSVPGVRIGGTAASAGTLSFEATLKFKDDPPTLDLA